MSEARSTRPRKNWLEWLVFGASLAIIVATAGFLTYSSLSMDDSPPRLEVYLGEPRAERGVFVVPVVVQNLGRQPASGVRIEVALTIGQAAEYAGFELAYSPGGSTRRGEVAFLRDPHAGALRARAPGYELP